MKKILTSIAAATLLAGLVAAQPQPRYTVIDLGAMGGAYSSGFGINIEGDVVGAAATPAQTDGFAATASLWNKRNGKIGATNLGVLGAPHFPSCPTCNSDAAAISAFGLVAMVPRLPHWIRMAEILVSSIRPIRRTVSAAGPFGGMGY